MLRFALLACLVLTACSRQKGAVVVRWRLVDGTTSAGTVASSCDARAPDAACCARVASQKYASTVNSSGAHDVNIDSIRLHIQRTADVNQPGALEVPCASCCFTCASDNDRGGEHTTNFELPEGDYKLWLSFLRCGLPIGDVPPAVVRHVTAGEITNLNAIEIRIDPNQQSPFVCDVAAGQAAGPTCTAQPYAAPADAGSDGG